MMIKQLLKNVGTSNSSKSLVRLVALTAAGTGLLYTTSGTDSKTTVSVTVSAPSSELLLPKWPILRGHSVVNLDHPTQGNIQLVVSKIGSVPSEDSNQNADTRTGDGSKSIATAVAMTGLCTKACGVRDENRVLSEILPKMNGKTLGSSKGSGTLIHSDGTILTCAHLVSDCHGRRVTSKRKVDITLWDGQAFVGTVVNSDLHSDIAIVKITSRTPFPFAKLGSSSKLRPGDSVVTMGAPHSLRNSIAAGVVSCVDRKGSEMGLGGMLREYIQTDCATNPGLSGGPLINLDGEVIGVHVMSIGPGLAAAVPIDSVLRILEQFKWNGRYIRPWLGLKTLDLDMMIISQLKNRDSTFPDVKKGVLVLMVSPSSPADLAGIRPGDVVFEFRGKPVGSISEISQLMEDQIGIPLKIVVKRANNIVETLTVVPEEANPEI